MKNVIIRKSFPIVLFLVFFAFPQSDTLEYSADRVEYSVIDSTITLSGNARIDYKGIELTADSISYFTDTKIMIANGNPVLVDGNDTLRGEYIAYNIKTRKGKVKFGLMYSDADATYYGESIVRSDSSIYANHGLYTTCEFADKPHSHFYCEKIRILPGDKTVAKPFVLVVGDAPMAALPYFIIPLEKNRTSGWLPIRWGVTLNGRGDVDNIGYYWAVNDYLDFMLAGKVDNFENFLVKGATNYALKDILTGGIYTDYSVNDRYYGKNTRWSLNFNHKQDLLPDKSFSLTGNGQLVSDKKYYLDYSDDTLMLTNQDLSSNLSLMKRFDDIGGYASISWYRKQNLYYETIEQDLPAVNFTLGSRPLIPIETQDSVKQNILNKISWSYSYRANQKISEKSKIDSSYYKIHRGMSHSIPIRMPFNIFQYIKVTPNFTVSQSLFDSYRDTAAVVEKVFETLYDTIPLDSSGNSDYYGRQKDTVYLRDTSYVLLFRADTSWESHIYDTTYYYDERYKISKAHQVWWNTGVDVSTELFGIFPLKIGKLQGVRHTLTPRVGYLLTPQKDLDVVFPSVGGEVLSPRGTKRRQELSFGLNNLFEAKVLNAATADDSAKMSVKKINLLSASIAGGYNFEADSQKLSNISLTAGIPTQKVSLSYRGNYHPYDMRNGLDIPKPLSHSIDVTPILPSLEGNFWSGDVILYEGLQYYGYMDNVWKNNSRDWRINITPRYSYSMSRKDVISDFQTNKSYNLSASLSFNLTQRWKISWGGNWSFTQNQFINQSVGLGADLECWDLKLDWYPSGVNSGHVYFVAALKKHRDLKWEQREK